MGELDEVAARIVSLRDALRRVREIDPEAEEWARLTVAAELVGSAAHSLAELSPPDASVIDAWDETATATMVAPAEERAALLVELCPRMDAALDEAVMGLSTAELRALSSHPDDLAVLVLATGLVGRAEYTQEREDSAAPPTVPEE